MPLSFPANSINPLTFTITTSTVTGNVTCSFTVGDNDAAHYTAPLSRVLIVVPQSTFNISNFPPSLAVSETSQAISVAPVLSPFYVVSLSTSCTGGIIVTGSPLLFPAGSTAALSFTITTSTLTGNNFNCSYGVGGADAAHYQTPNNNSISVVIQSSFNIFNFPSSLSVSQSSQLISVSPVVSSFLFRGFDCELQRRDCYPPL